MKNNSDATLQQHPISQVRTCYRTAYQSINQLRSHHRHSIELQNIKLFLHMVFRLLKTSSAEVVG